MDAENIQFNCENMELFWPSPKLSELKRGHSSEFWNSKYFITGFA